MPPLYALVLFASWALVTSAAQGRNDADDIASNPAEWEETLMTLPGESLTLALEHNLSPQYQDGIFENGHVALHAVHSSDPNLATKVVELAKQDADIKQYLKRRQNTNTTASSSSSASTSSMASLSSTDTGPTEGSSSSAHSPTIVNPSTSTFLSSSHLPFTGPLTSTSTRSSPQSSLGAPTNTGLESSAQTGVLVPVTVPATSAGIVVESTSLAFQPSAPTSITVDVTRNGIVSVSTAAAVAQTYSDNDGSIRTTYIPVTSAVVAPGGSIISVDMPADTSTDESGNVVTVTFHPGGGTVSELELFTTTLPNGAPTIITSFAQVKGGGTTTTESEATQATSSPDLQSGAAAPSSWYAAEVALILGAAIGAAGLIT